jgi:hypothetical protein
MNNIADGEECVKVSDSYRLRGRFVIPALHQTSRRSGRSGAPYENGICPWSGKTALASDAPSGVARKLVRRIRDRLNSERIQAIMKMRVTIFLLRLRFSKLSQTFPENSVKRSANDNGNVLAFRKRISVGLSLFASLFRKILFFSGNAKIRILFLDLLKLV